MSNNELREHVATEVEKLTEQESLDSLEQVKNRICDKVRQIQQQKEEKKLLVGSFNEIIKDMTEQLEEDIIRKTELESNVRRLNVLANPVA